MNTLPPLQEAAQRIRSPFFQALNSLGRHSVEENEGDNPARARSLFPGGSRAGESGDSVIIESSPFRASVCRRIMR